MLEPLVYLGCLGHELGLEQHVFVQKLHVQLAVLQFHFLLLVLIELHGVRMLDQEGFGENRD